MRCKDKTIFTTVQNIEKFFYLHDRPRQQAFGRSQINLAPAPIFFTFVKRIIWFSEQQTRIFAENEEEGISLSLQFKSPDTDTLERWHEECGETLLCDMQKKFGKQVLGFSTLLEVIDL